MRELIVITPPTFFVGEADIITALLMNGVSRLHIRKPYAKEDDMRSLLTIIPLEYHSRLVLHDCFQLSKQECVGGVHVNKRCNVAPGNFKGTISRSCHSVEELEAFGNLDYLFLSPVFDSISKEGYKGSYSLSELKRLSARGIINKRVIALGGIDKNTIEQLAGINFGGYALLGAVWGKEIKDIQKEKVLERFLSIKNTVEKHGN